MPGSRLGAGETEMNKKTKVLPLGTYILVIGLPLACNSDNL